MASPEVHDVTGLTDPETSDQAEPAQDGLVPLRRPEGSRRRIPSLEQLDLPGRYRELRAHMASPLYRNAYALMINTAVTGVLGVLYWLLAARSYTAVEVGRASAAYSAMNLVSGFTAYNLVGAITRFLPQTGSRTKSWVLKTYLFSALASIVVTIPFLLTVSHWGPTYSELTGLVPGLAFLVSVVTWSIFTLQDGVMTGLRNAIWVPLENGMFGIVKIILLVAFAAAIPTVGIFVSWMLPVFVSLPLVNGLIFFKLMPRHEHLTAHRTPPTNRQIGKFLAGDYIGAMCLLGINNLVPILVAIRIGPDKSAYFYIAWTIGQVLDLLAVNMAMSVTVESAFDAATLAANVRSALRRLAIILLPIVALVARARAVRAPPVRARVRLVRRAGTGTAGPGHVAEGPDRAVPGGHAGAEPAQDDRGHPDRPVRPRPRLALALTGLIGVSGAAVGALATQLFVAILIFPKLRQVMSARATRADRAAEPAPEPAVAPALADAAAAPAAAAPLTRADLDKTIIGPLPPELREAAFASARNAALSGRPAPFTAPVNEAFDNYAARTLTLPIRAIAVALGDAAVTSPLDVVSVPRPAGPSGTSRSWWSRPVPAVLAAGGPGRRAAGGSGRGPGRPPERGPKPRRPKPAQPQQSSSFFDQAPKWLSTMLIAVLGAAGVALFFGTVGSATPRLSDMNGLGMISILPATTVAGIALLGMAFVLALGMSRPRPLLLGALVAAIVICLDGVTVVLEPDPRFPTAYWIAGFVDYIYRTGHSSPALSAYFSWPGFFEVVAFIEHVVGSTNLMPVLKFWPVTIDLLSLVPMGLIVKRLHATWRAKWLALFIFTVGNWVGQDYFSPQSFNYLLYLFFLALLITYFGKQATERDTRLRSGRSPAGQPPAPLPAVRLDPEVHPGGPAAVPARPSAAGRHAGRDREPGPAGRRGRCDRGHRRLLHRQPSAHAVLHGGGVRGAGPDPALPAAHPADPARRDLRRLGQLRCLRVLVRPHQRHVRRPRGPWFQPVHQRVRADDR